MCSKTCRGLNGSYSSMCTNFFRRQFGFSLQQSLYHGDFVDLSVASLDLLRSDGLPHASFSLPMAIVSYFVLMSKHFARQFVKAGGISAMKACRMLERAPTTRLGKEVDHWLRQSERCDPRGHVHPPAHNAFLRGVGDSMREGTFAATARMFRLAANRATAAETSEGSSVQAATTASVTSLIADSLNVLSYLARLSNSHYSLIAKSKMEDEFRALCWDPVPEVRAKLCNLVGNLCKHSGECYPLLSRELAGPMPDDSDLDALEGTGVEPHRLRGASNVRGAGGGGGGGGGGGRNLLDHLVTRLRDDDAATRKFACFAIGNAAFHNDALYANLRQTIPPLIDVLCYDEMSKSRANAAGALGNLVRNSPMLCSALIKAHAPEALLRTAMSDGHQQPQRIALFSLGNLCAYRSCRDILLAGRDGGGGDKEQTDLLGSLAQLEQKNQSDAIVLKYIQRIRGKLAQPAFARGGDSGSSGSAKKRKKTKGTARRTARTVT